MNLNLSGIIGKPCPVLLLFMALATLFSIASADAFILEPDSVFVRQEHFKMKNWDAKLNGLKVAVLSDIHQHNGDRELSRLERIVRMTNAENPDIVLLLGDYLGELDDWGRNNATPEEIASRLAKLQPKYGTFAVLGNHDWWGDGKGMAEALQKYNITMLENQFVTLSVNDVPLNIVGLPDFSTRIHKIDPKRLPHASVPTLVMSHDPILLAGCPDLPPYELTFSGHTHGGQIGIPLVREIITPTVLYEPYVRGRYDVNGRILYITSGLGCSLMRLRFFCVPEIVIATLEQQ